MQPVTADVSFDVNLGTLVVAVAAFLIPVLFRYLGHKINVGFARLEGIFPRLDAIDAKQIHQDACTDSVRTLVATQGAMVAVQGQEVMKAALEASTQANRAALEAMKLASDLAKEASIERAELLQRLARIEKSANITPMSQVGA